MPKCWAQNISQCEGPQSGEHYVSKGLLDPNGIRIKGLPFCQDDLVDIPISGAKANILCKHHNELLSPLDQEAIKLKKSVLWDPKSSAAPARATAIDGLSFSRWIAKTYCNMKTVGKEVPDPEFVKYAFSKKTSCYFRLYVWFPNFPESKRQGLVQCTPEDHFRYREIFSDDEVIIFIRFFSLRFVLANTSCKQYPYLRFDSETLVDTRHIKTPARIWLRRNLGSGQLSSQYQISFKWRREFRK